MYVQTISIIFLSISLNYKTLHAKTWSEANEGRCKFTVNHDDDIQFLQNPSLFIKNLHTSDLRDCRKVCCEHVSCNGYVWDAKDPVENCKLLKCSDEGTDCKQALRLTANTVDKSNHEVGFITGVNNNPKETSLKSSTLLQTTATPTTTPTPQDPLVMLNVDSPVLKQALGTLLETTAAPQSQLDPKLNTTTTSIPINKISPTNKNRTHTTIHQLQKIVSTLAPLYDAEAHLNSTTSTINKTTVIYIGPTRRNFKTAKGVINTNSLEDSHSDNLSLTAALVFGIVFILATVYFVGKRWVEGFKDSHRRGYTRISYLLNGV